MTDAALLPPIAVYGDSTVRGWTTNGRFDGPKPGADGAVGSVVDMPWPAGLQALLRDRFGVMVTVENHGINGTTCTDWLNGTGGVARPWAAEMAASKAWPVLLGLGINDGPGELSEAFPQLLQIARGYGKTVVVVTPNQILTGYGGTEDRAAVEVMAAKALGFPAADVCSYTATMPDLPSLLSYSTIIEGYWSGIHPTQAGYDLIASLVFPVVAKLLESPP